jgi:FkbM family methyltransferase
LYKNSWYQLDAYQKKQTKHYLEKYFGLQFQKKSTFNYPENFNWAELSDDDISTIKREIVDEQAYRVFRDVQANDIVLDIGASVGAFTVSILDQKPRQVYCVEPSKNLIKALIENCADKLMANPISIAFINHGIVGESNEKIDIFGKDESYTTMTFAQLIENYAITWVDYLKIDCEGGEYSIFNKDNIEFLMKQVGFIAMEMHLKCSNGRQKFIDFRNHYLSRFKNYTVLSCTTQNIAYGTVVDLTQKIQDDTFVNNYQCEFMIYIDNNTQ